VIKINVKDDFHKITKIIGIVFVIVVLLILVPSFIVVITDGEVGVQKTLGKINNNELYSGLHFAVPPFSSITKWDVRTQEIKETAAVPSKEGLIVTLDVSVIYHLDPENVAELRKTTSVNYWETLLIPYVRNAIRDISSKYKVEDLYSEFGRQSVSVDMYEYLVEKLEYRGIIIEDVLLRDIGIPLELTKAIELKLTKEQEVLQKNFQLQVAKKEAEIRVAEAEGIAKSQLIIDKTLTPEYLQYLSIQNINPDADVIYLQMNGLLPITEATRFN
jgi:regulator of protease activity HflC (stomatin/prohibitin superfamily)